MGIEIESREVLVVSPHPDDEIIGAGATLLKMRDAGFKIVNLAVSLGRPEQQERRRRELHEACQRARFELLIPEQPVAISNSDDLEAAQAEITSLLNELLMSGQHKIVVSPSLHDGHHGHEVVARAVRDSLMAGNQETLWWMYRLWGELPIVSLYSSFDQARMDEVAYVLDAHIGENDRNNYRNLIIGRAMMNSVYGSEKVFGFGTGSVSSQPYAELLTEVQYSQGKWLKGKPRILTAERALHNPTDEDLSFWINSPSFSQQRADR